MEWYEKWFNQDYLKLYQRRDDEDAYKQISLALSHIPHSDKTKVLDLCCGNGRHSNILFKKNLQVTGLDLSSTLINLAKKNYPQVKFYRGDMRYLLRYEYLNYFDVIFNLFSSFGYFKTDRENFLVFENIFKKLNSQGYFWFDFLNANYVKKNLIKTSEKELDSVRIVESRTYDSKKKRIVKKIFFDKNKKEYKESIRAFSMEELKIALKKTGFKIKKIFGDYLGHEFSIEDSPRLLLLCQK